MMKTVMMMLVTLATARNKPDVDAMNRRVILMLNFKETYDVVARYLQYPAVYIFLF